VRSGRRTGDEGLEGEYGAYGRIGERTWQRLLEYKWGSLVEERGTRQLRRVPPTMSAWSRRSLTGWKMSVSPLADRPR
jgi:hypothetical protein